MAYIKTSKEQNWLLPPSIKEIIPKGHVCFLVEDFVDSLDFSNFDLIYDGAGHMETQEARKIYSLRKITVGPVYGNIKQNLGFREFLLRDKEKVKIEFNLACITHNLQKIWKLRGINGC